MSDQTNNDQTTPNTPAPASTPSPTTGTGADEPQPRASEGSDTVGGGSPLAAPPSPASAGGGDSGGEPLSAPGEASLDDLSLGAPQPTTVAPERPDAHGWWWGTGRRKSARARVRIKPGSGEVKIQINRDTFKSVEEYFTELRDRGDAKAPLKVTKNEGSLDVVARLDGGGYMGQAQALRLGIARALKKYDPALEGVLRDHGYLTRDAREVERKKYGQRGARRRFQFSKR
jgi:small subunit ribosomal protein S9